MKKLLLIAIIALSGCSPQYNQHFSLERAFRAGCSTDTLSSNLTTTGDTLVFTATCTRAK